jgi:hypothetical protein
VTDPDRLLQQLLNATSAELRRIRANAKYGGFIEIEGVRTQVQTCPLCKRDLGMSDAERKWLVEAGKLMSAIAFGARKMIADKLLKALSEGGLESFANGMAEREKEGKWLPDV